MAKYGGSRYGGSRGDKRSSRYGSGRHGSSSRYGSRSSRGRGRDEYDEDYEEQPYSAKGKQDKHEQAGIIIFGAAAVVVIITIILVASGHGTETAKKAMRLEKGGYYERDAREMAASDALGKARYFDQANPYEDKEIVAGMYQDVMNRYAGTQAAGEAAQKYQEVMDRRR